MEKKKNSYIQILKFIACLLITNSHCPYPETSRTIAAATSLLQVGGGWGNAIFFGITGYLCLKKTEPFSNWIWKRYVRIVPITIVFATLKYFFLTDHTISYPKYLVISYWFVTALVVYYPVLFFLNSRENGYIWGLIIWGMVYIALYVTIYSESFFVEPGGITFFKVYSFFGTILTGALVSKYSNNAIYKGKTWIITGLISILMWACVYGIIIFTGSGYELQFLVTISRMLIVVSVILFALKFSEKKPLELKKNGIVNSIADATLEIYLVQILFKELVERQGLTIGSIFVFWAIAIVGGLFIHVISNFFESVIRKNERK